MRMTPPHPRLRSGRGAEERRSSSTSLRSARSMTCVSVGGKSRDSMYAFTSRINSLSMRKLIGFVLSMGRRVGMSASIVIEQPFAVSGLPALLTCSILNYVYYSQYTPIASVDTLAGALKARA